MPVFKKKLKIEDLEAGLKRSDSRLDELRAQKEDALTDYLEAEADGMPLSKKRDELTRIGQHIDLAERSVSLHLEKIEQFHLDAIKREVAGYGEVKAQVDQEFRKALNQAGYAIGLAIRILSDLGFGDVRAKLEAALLMNDYKEYEPEFKQGKAAAVNENDFSELRKKQQKSMNLMMLSKYPDLRANKMHSRFSRSTGRKHPRRVSLGPRKAE